MTERWPGAPSRESTDDVERPEQRAPTARKSLRHALLAIGVLIGVLIVVELALPDVAGRPPGVSVLDSTVVAVFAATGLLAWDRRPHNRMGGLMVLTAATLWASGMSDDSVPELRVIGLILQAVPLAAALHLLLAFPSGRVIGRPARIVVTTGYLVAVVLQAPVLLFAPPESALTSSLAIWPSVSASSASRLIQSAFGVATFVAAVIVLGQRLRRATPTERRQLGPFVGYGCVALLVSAATVSVLRFDTSLTMQWAVLVIQVAVMSGLAIAFLAGLLRGSFSRAGEAQEIAWSLGDATTDPGLLDAAVARALGDRTARVLYRSDGAQAFVDRHGATAQPSASGARGWSPVHFDDRPVGGIDYDATIIADQELPSMIAPAVGVAIDHQRLVVDLRTALRSVEAAAAQLRTSRRRIVIAADAERRRIARDLHDGAQQRIVLLGIEAQRIARRAEDPPAVRSQAERVTEQLRCLLDELRGLVHGIMPAALEERGLAAAVHSLTDRLEIPVHVHVEGLDQRLATEVESTGYFVIGEALANVSKHAAAQSVSVALERRGDMLTITVSDDGSGMGGAHWGFGLHGLQDRVAALDGTLTAQSGPGQGTTVRAEFPCG